MITREEYESLKNYRDIGFNWLARDKNLNLFTYREMPRRSSTIWDVGGAVRIRAERFTFVKWEDEKPTKIDDLIQDYEAPQIIVGESEKVVIPSFVAEWIEQIKGTYTLKLLFANSDMPSSVEDWLYCNNENCEKMARAWLDGYEVEKEKKKEKLYTVRLANGDCLCRIPSKGLSWVLTHQDYKNDKKYQLTQAEIESVDPILMQIAEEVEQ